MILYLSKVVGGQISIQPMPATDTGKIVSSKQHWQFPKFFNVVFKVAQINVKKEL